jgi:hypothetical protein
MFLTEKHTNIVQIFRFMAYAYRRNSTYIIKMLLFEQNSTVHKFYFVTYTIQYLVTLHISNIINI